MALTRPKIWDINTDVAYFMDPLTTLHQGATSPNQDVGFIFNRANGLVSNVAVYWSEAQRSIMVAYTNDSGNTDANVVATSYANLTIGSLITINNGGITINGNTGLYGQQITSDGVGGVYWQYPIYTGGIFNANVNILPNTVSTSATTGALTVAGGVGLLGNLYVGQDVDVSGNLTVHGTTTFINTEIVSGVEIVAGNLVANSGTTSTSTTTGALVVAGGAGVSGNLYISGNIVSSSTGALTVPAGSTSSRPGNPTQGMVRYNTTTGSFEGFGAGSAWASLGGVKSVDGYAYISAEASPAAGDDVLRFYSGSTGSSTQVMWASGSNVSILPTTTSTSTSTGALQVAGGVGVVGNINIGNQLNFAGITSNIAITSGVPVINQGDYSVAIGQNAGVNSQKTQSVAIGKDAGTNSQGQLSVAIGSGAGYTTQGQRAVAVGVGTGYTTQGNSAVAVGDQAGQTSQGVYAVAIGKSAGATNQGNAAIAIGYNAGLNNQPNNSIVISAQSDALSATGSGLFVSPIRPNNTGWTPLVYDTSTKEVMAANGNIVVSATTTSTSTSTGALVIKGGTGISGNLTVGGNIVVGNALAAATTFSLGNGIAISDAPVYSTSVSQYYSPLSVVLQPASTAHITGRRTAGVHVDIAPLNTQAYRLGELIGFRNNFTINPSILAGEFATGISNDFTANTGSYITGIKNTISYNSNAAVSAAWGIQNSLDTSTTGTAQFVGTTNGLSGGTSSTVSLLTGTSNQLTWYSAGNASASYGTNNTLTLYAGNAASLYGTYNNLVTTGNTKNTTIDSLIGSESALSITNRSMSIGNLIGLSSGVTGITSGSFYGYIGNTYGIKITSLTIPNQLYAPYAIYSSDPNARTYHAGNVTIGSSNASNSTTTGALVVTGGVGISGALYTGSTASHAGNVAITSGGGLTTTQTTGYLFNETATTLNIGSAATTLNIGAATGNTTINSANVILPGNLYVQGATTTVYINKEVISSLEVVAGVLAANSTAPSTSTTSGALIVAGGTGIGGNIVFGGGNVSTPATEMILGSVGDALGPMYLRLQNRSGQAGPLFDGTGSTVPVIDFSFKTVNSQKNIRFETRGGAYKFIQAGDGNEFQFAQPIGGTFVPTFVIGSTGVLVNANTTSANVTTGAFVANGSAGIVGNLSIGSNLYLYSDSTTISSGLLSTDYFVLARDGVAPGAAIISAGSAAANRAVFKGTRSRGTLASPVVPQANDEVLSFMGAIYDGATSQGTAMVDFVVDGTVSTGVAPQRVGIYTGEGNGSSRIERLTVKATGNVGIANTSPVHTFSVTGNAYVSTTATSGTLVVNGTSTLGSITVMPDGTVYRGSGQIQIIGGGFQSSRNNILIGNGSGITIYGGLSGQGGQINLDGGNYNVLVSQNTTANSTTTGALVVTGGVGVSGNVVATGIYVGAGSQTSGIFWSANNLPLISYSTVTSALGYTPPQLAMTGNVNSIVSTDSRAINYSPQDRDRGLYVDFKTNTTDSLVDGGTYHGVLTFRPYGTTTDFSGSKAHQIGLTDNTNLWHRSGSATTWGSWYKLLDSNNYSAYSTFTSNIVAAATTSSTSTTTGALVVNGGAGIAGAVVAASVVVNSTSISSTTSAIQVAGDISLIGPNRSVLGNMYYQGGWKYSGNGYGWGFRENNAGVVEFLNTPTVNASGNGAAATVSIGAICSYDLINSRLGIGTSSPSAKAHVKGDLIVENSSTTTGTVRNAGVKVWTDSAFGMELHYGSGSQSAGWGTAIYGRATDTVAVRIGAYAGSATAQNTLSEYVTVLNSGNVGIGTVTPSYKLHVNGSFAATTKSFVIDHPTKPGKKLRYGSLEGPENGVYVRGRLTGSNTIELPEYWTKLVDPNSITVNLTPIGRHQNLYIIEADNTQVVVGNSNLLGKGIDCYYTVYGERCDVDKLGVEID